MSRKAKRLSVLGALLLLTVIAKLYTWHNGIFIESTGGYSCYPRLKHGDVGLFQRSQAFEPGDIACFRWQGQSLVKEVVAVPGDEVTLQNDRRKGCQTRVIVNSRAMTSKYVWSWPVCDSDSSLQIGQTRKLGSQEYLFLPPNKVGAEKCAYTVQISSIRGKMIGHWSVVPEPIVLGWMRLAHGESIAYQQEALPHSL